MPPALEDASLIYGWREADVSAVDETYKGDPILDPFNPLYAVRKDVLLGGAGDDILQGGPGEDWIFGGTGNDVLAAAWIAARAICYGVKPAMTSIRSKQIDYQPPKQPCDGSVKIRQRPLYHLH